MKNSLFLFLSILFIFSSCCKDVDGFQVIGTLIGANSYQSNKVDESHLQLRKEFIWRNEHLFEERAMPESNFYFSKNGSVRLKHVANDNPIWESHKLPNIPTTKNSYFGENYIVTDYANLHIVTEISSGNLIYKEELINSECVTHSPKITGFGDLFFQVGTIPLTNNQDQYQDVVFVGNMNTPDPLEILLKPDFPTEPFNLDDRIGSIGDITSFEDTNGDIILALIYSMPIDSCLEKISFGLWNINTEQWRYKDIPFMNHSNKYKIYLKGKKLYCYNDLKISCYNLNDGSLIWEKESELSEMKYQFLNDFIIVGNGNLEILNYEDGEILKVYQGEVYSYAASSKYIYITHDELKIFDIESSRIVKTIKTPYVSYPEETPEYFQKTNKLSVIEDKNSGADYLFISQNGYNFKMKMKH